MDFGIQPGFVPHLLALVLRGVQSWILGFVGKTVPDRGKDPVLSLKYTGTVQHCVRYQSAICRVVFFFLPFQVPFPFLFPLCDLSIFFKKKITTLPSSSIRKHWWFFPPATHWSRQLGARDARDIEAILGRPRRSDCTAKSGDPTQEFFFLAYVFTTFTDRTFMLIQVNFRRSLWLYCQIIKGSWSSLPWLMIYPAKTSNISLFPTFNWTFS